MLIGDFCQIWYHGICISITPEDTHQMDLFKCFVCVQAVVNTEETAEIEKSPEKSTEIPEFSESNLEVQSLESDDESESFLNEMDSPKRKLLKTEMKLCNLNEAIKWSLHKKFVKPKTQNSLKSLNAIKNIIQSVTTMMLIKNPNCLETIKRLKKYQPEDLSSDAENIRSISLQIYNSCKEKFNFSKKKSFFSQFKNVIDDFNKKTEKIPHYYLVEMCFEDEYKNL